MLTIMFMWFHWCSCGFIYAPVVSFTVCSCGFMMFMWFHWCSCSCGFIYVHVVSLYSWGINFQWYVNVYVKYMNPYTVRDCIDVYMWLKGAPSKEFLEQPITASDHPFLRANVTSIKAHKMQQRALKGKSISKIY